MQLFLNVKLTELFDFLNTSSDTEIPTVFNVACALVVGSARCPPAFGMAFAIASVHLIIAYFSWYKKSFNLILTIFGFQVPVHSASKPLIMLPCLNVLSPNMQAVPCDHDKTIETITNKLNFSSTYFYFFFRGLLKLNNSLIVFITQSLYNFADY